MAAPLQQNCCMNGYATRHIQGGHLEVSSIGAPSVGIGLAHKGYPLILSGTIFVSCILLLVICTSFSRVFYGNQSHSVIATDVNFSPNI